MDREARAGYRVVGVVRLDGDAVGTLLLLAKLVKEAVLQERLQQTEGDALAVGELLVTKEGELYFAQIPLGVDLEGTLDDTLTGAVVTDRVGATWSLGVARQGRQISCDDALSFGFADVTDETACQL